MEAESRGELELDGRRYCWRRVGQGPPLVLINGYAATCDDWDPVFLGALGESFSVICPESRGMGDSDLGAEPASIDAMATDVVALLDHLAIKSAPVAGWSMGGFVAQRLSRVAPDRVERLVLLSTDPGGEVARRCPEKVWARLTDRSGTPREQASRLLGLLFPPSVAEQIDREFGEVVAQARAALSQEALDWQERAMEEWHATDTEQGSPLPGPVLAVAGSLDEVIPAANARALADKEGDWAASFDGGGHAFMAQEPRRLATLIATFLAE